MPSNRLSIYLIKSEFDTPELIIKNINEISHQIAINANTTLFVKDSYIHSPAWIKKFFIRTLDDCNIKNSSSQAILLIKLSISESDIKYFAITFGFGHCLLKPGVIEERFGLKVVLNTVDETKLRSIDKRNMSTIPKNAREQISLNSAVSEFGIDIEQDLVLGVTGKSKDSAFGKTITGRDLLKVSVEVNIDSINEFLLKCYTQYNKTDYKTSFGWIDQINEIQNPSKVNSLFTKLIDKIKSNEFSKLWMAIPELVDWEDIDGFSYSNDASDNTYDDIELSTFLNILYPDNDYSLISISDLKNHTINCTSISSGVTNIQWKIYNCLYCELEDTESTYILTNGKWYQINNDFVAQINQSYREIISKQCNINLPQYNHNNENEYNTYVPSQLTSFCCMDRQSIPYGGGYSKVEFCDLFSLEKDIIHVKYYSGSSVLSHLFNQGLVSGELFRSERDFRDKLNVLLPVSHKFANVSRINPSDYKIIFGIISKHSEALNIPFFSKVSLKNVRKRLESIGYNVFITKISI